MKKYIIKTHQFFKEASYAPLVLGLFAILLWCLPSNSQSTRVPVKPLTVSLTENEWAMFINQLEAVKATLKKSDLPARDVSYITDSIFTPFQNKAIAQLNKQIADTTKNNK